MRNSRLHELYTTLGLSSAAELYDVACGNHDIDEEDLEQMMDHLAPGYLDELACHDQEEGSDSYIPVTMNARGETVLCAGLGDGL